MERTMKGGSAMMLLMFAVSTVYGADPFLADWMGNMLPAIGNLTLLDLSFPGTHDTMTYDLSTTVSAGGLDQDNVIVWILKTFPEVFPEAWIRKQSQTQGLTIEQQLDNGLRYLDFRVMFTAGDWYCLHCMQSNQKSTVYLTQIRDWLLKHPKEIIFMTLSKHGSVCDVGNDQYNKIAISTKQAFWKQILELFDGLVFDTSISTLNTTSVSDLIARNHRVVFFASDYDEFTGSSHLAYNACQHVNNILGSDITNVELTNQNHLALFSNGSQSMAESKAASVFALLSMATSSPELQLRYAFEVAYVPVEQEYHRSLCSQEFNFTNVTDWCPPTLLDMCQTMNFYNQFALNAAFKNSWRLPNAIYLDALDDDGTIRTGTSLLNPLSSGPASPLVPRSSLVSKLRDDTHTDTKSAYVDILLMHNLRQACGLDSSKWSAVCSSLGQNITQRMAKYPFAVWDDFANARVSNQLPMPTL